MRAHSREDWDAQARRFEERVCHVLAEDRGGVVAKAIAAEARRLARGRTRRRILAGDFGCGTGRALRLLLRSFGSVLAIDTSEACLALACAAAGPEDEITFIQADLGAARLSLPLVDAGLCVNVAIMPDEKARSRVLGNVARHVRKGGRLLLVVPALESELLVRRVVAELSGARPREGRGERLADGIVRVGGVATKCWTREELGLLAPKIGCRALSIERVEYGWETELDRPPRGLREPHPWDWLVVLERRR